MFDYLYLDSLSPVFLALAGLGILFVYWLAKDF